MRTRQGKLRRVLGLGPAPDPVGARFTADGRMESVPEAERSAAFAAWHTEGRTERAADALADLPGRTRGLVRRGRGRLADLRAERALAAARTLHFRSPHIHPIGETGDVEGFFELGRGRRYWLELIAAGTLDDFARADWERGELVERRGSVILAWCDWVLVPGETLDEELVAEALRRWYASLFEWRRGHWSQVERRLPEITVDLAWETPERYYGDTPFARSG